MPLPMWGPNSRPQPARLLRLADDIHQLLASHSESGVVGAGVDATSSKHTAIEPAPTRRQTTSWATFLRSHWDVFEEFGLEAITLWFSKLIVCVIEPASCDNAVVDGAVIRPRSSRRIVSLILPLIASAS